MTEEELLAMALPDLFALGRAILDAIEKKSAVDKANAEVATANASIDAAEAAKLGVKAP